MKSYRKSVHFMGGITPLVHKEPSYAFPGVLAKFAKGFGPLVHCGQGYTFRGTWGTPWQAQVYKP